jgi:antitoxin YefM
MAVTASEARKNLFPLIEQVNDDRTPIEITSRRGDAVLLSRLRRPHTCCGCPRTPSD